MAVSKAADDSPESGKATGKADICGATTSPPRLLESCSHSQERNGDDADGLGSTVQLLRPCAVLDDVGFGHPVQEVDRAGNDRSV